MEGISIHRLAEIELNEAAEYYESEQAGLGARFLREVERCLQLIVEHPEAAPVVLGHARRRVVRRFPYEILYTFKHDEVRVLAIMNLKRRPLYWVGRS